MGPSIGPTDNVIEEVVPDKPKKISIVLREGVFCDSPSHRCLSDINPFRSTSCSTTICDNGARSIGSFPGMAAGIQGIFSGIVSPPARETKRCEDDGCHCKYTSDDGCSLNAIPPDTLCTYSTSCCTAL